MWFFLNETRAILGAQDRPKMPLAAILGSLGAVFGYLRVDLRLALRVGDPKIDLKMAQKVWVFSNETDLGLSSAYLA